MADLLAELDPEVAERIRARREQLILQGKVEIYEAALAGALHPSPCAAICPARAAGRPCEECRKDGESG